MVIFIFKGLFSGLVSGVGGGLEKRLDHLQARREVEREEFAFVKELIGWGRGGFSVVGSRGGHLKLKFPALRISFF